MANQLETDLLNMLYPHKDRLPWEDIKAQITIILNEYSIDKKCTEVAIRSEDTNEYYIKLFLASKAAGGRTDRTLKSYRTYLTKIFSAIDKNADEITADDIKLYLAKKLRVDKISKVSVDNERRTLSTFYEWMMRNEHIERNPMYMVETMHFNKPKKFAFSDMEVEKLREACATEREQMIVEVLLSTWCRVSELCGIRRDELESDRVIVHGKGEKDRTVFLNAKAQIAIARYLDKRKDGNPYLLPRSSESGNIVAFTKGKPRGSQRRWYEDASLVDPERQCDKGTIESIVRDLGKRAGVANTHPHRFRRTGATNALKAGMPVTTVSKLLGHSNISVTQVYLDISEEDLEHAHEKYVR